MKKILSVLLVVALAITMIGVLAACNGGKDGGEETTAPIETTAPENNGEGEDTGDDTGDETDAPEGEDTAIKEGTLNLSDLVTIELKDGWYTEEGIDTMWNSVELVNDSVTAFMANVKVSVGNLYGGDTAESWANDTNANYNNEGKVTAEEINGTTYYHLSGVVADDTQNIYFADIDETHYIKVAIMFMTVEEGKSVFDLLTINK